jgi:hypothetical protein
MFGKLWIAWFSLIVCGCATPEWRFTDYSLPVIEVNVERGSYTIDGERRALSNCETRGFYCLYFAGLGALAMSKDCSAFENEFSVQGVAGTYRLIAPLPHLSQPAGSFVNSENPNLVFAFNRFDGLFQIDLYENESDSGERSVRSFRVRASDGRQIFECQ